VPEAKPYDIPKNLVWEAYQRVKANRGAAGVDGESLEAFEKDLKRNLYKIWNRMSSGSYFPPPVRLVEIPKASGGTRGLGIPTVADRIAQTVVTMVLEPEVEPRFHPDSYGYRPGRSALDAVGKARERCWRYDWVIDLDIKAFFDSLDWDLVERAVAHHTELAWVRLYIARWLRAPVQKPDGTVELRTKGTPQGGVATPLTQRKLLIQGQNMAHGNFLCLGVHGHFLHQQADDSSSFFKIQIGQIRFHPLREIGELLDQL